MYLSYIWYRSDPKQKLQNLEINMTMNVSILGDCGNCYIYF